MPTAMPGMLSFAINGRMASPTTLRTRFCATSFPSRAAEDAHRTKNVVAARAIRAANFICRAYFSFSLSTSERQSVGRPGRQVARFRSAGTQPFARNDRGSAKRHWWPSADGHRSSEGRRPKHILGRQRTRGLVTRGKKILQELHNVGLRPQVFRTVAAEEVFRKPIAVSGGHKA